MNSMKKYFLYLIGAFCSLLAPLLLVFIAQPFFHIEGDMSHGVLNGYGEPGNLICIVIIPSILIAVCLFFSYFLLIHKKRMNNINIVLSLVVSIIFTIVEVLVLALGSYMATLELLNYMIPTIVGYPVVAFSLYCLWKQYSYSLKYHKNKGIEEKRKNEVL